MFSYLYLHSIVLTRITSMHNITNFILSMPLED